MDSSSREPSREHQERTATASPNPHGSVAEAVERLTRQTCQFAEHIDRNGEGWTRTRVGDVCAALGALEAAERRIAELEAQMRGLLHGLPEILETGGLVDEEGLIEAAWFTLTRPEVEAAIAKAEGF